MAAVIFEATEDSVTGVAGIALWGELLDRLGLVGEADRRNLRPIGPGGYTGGKYYRPLVELQLTGSGFLSDRSPLADEAAAALLPGELEVRTPATHGPDGAREPVRRPTAEGSSRDTPAPEGQAEEGLADPDRGHLHRRDEGRDAQTRPWALSQPGQWSLTASALSSTGWVSLWLYAAIWTWYIPNCGTTVTWIMRPWYQKKTVPSFLDALATLRRFLSSERISAMSSDGPLNPRIIDGLLDVLTRAA